MNHETTQISVGGMSTAGAHSASYEAHAILSEHCAAHPRTLHTVEPTGAEILVAFGRPPTPEQVVLQLLRAGGMEEIRLDERVNLALGNKFVIAGGDRLFRFTVNSKQYEWPYRFVAGALVLELAGVDQDHIVGLTRNGVQSRIAPSELVDLSREGLEQFTTVLPFAVTIVINMTEIVVHERELSYGRLANLAYPQDSPADQSDIVYTITVSYHQGPTVTVVRGGKPALVQKGMVCNVRKTTRS